MDRRQITLANVAPSELLDADAATPLSVTASTTAQTILAANVLRKGATFENDADKACYLKFGAGASPTSYTKKIHPKDAQGVGGFLSLGDLRCYTGLVSAVWDGPVTGALRTTELS
jgi:hypothetical protein